MDTVQHLIAGTSDIPIIGIYLLPIVANLFPGIPEEIFLLGVGYLSREGAFPFWQAYLVFFCGFFLVDLILFAISRKGAFFAQRMEKRFAHMHIDLNPKKINQDERKIIFISRFIPFLRWIGPVLTGIAHVSYIKFMRSNAIALLIYVPTILLIGRIFHTHINSIIEGIHALGGYVSTGLFIILFLIVATWGRKKFLKMMREGQQKNF